MKSALENIVDHFPRFDLKVIVGMLLRAEQSDR
jgi:hypothetical protein